MAPNVARQDRRGEPVGSRWLLKDYSLKLIPAIQKSFARMVWLADMSAYLRLHAVSKMDRVDMGWHQPLHEVAGYFYYYGHYYAALDLEQLPGETRADYQNLLAKLIVPLQEANGSWWDYPLYNYHEPYGTSFALMTLLRCVPAKSAE